MMTRSESRICHRRTTRAIGISPKRNQPMQGKMHPRAAQLTSWANARTSASESKNSNVWASRKGRVEYARSSHEAISFRTVPTKVDTKKANSGLGS